eukprot:gene26809-biopygen17394
MLSHGVRGGCIKMGDQSVRIKHTDLPRRGSFGIGMMLGKQTGRDIS